MRYIEAFDGVIQEVLKLAKNHERPAVIKEINHQNIAHINFEENHIDSYTPDFKMMIKNVE